MPWSDDDLDEREYPDEDCDNDDTPTRECSRCGTLVYEDAEQCPRCDTWLTADTSPWKGRAWWWVALGIMGIVALVAVLTLVGL